MCAYLIFEVIVDNGRHSQRSAITNHLQSQNAQQRQSQYLIVSKRNPIRFVAYSMVVHRNFKEINVTSRSVDKTFGVFIKCKPKTSVFSSAAQCSKKGKQKKTKKKRKNPAQMQSRYFIRYNHTLQGFLSHSLLATVPKQQPVYVNFNT